MHPTGKLIVFSAPSGSGKTTIVKHLLSKEELNLEFSVSATNRQMREGEVAGENYYFISIEEFKESIKNNKFIEWEEVYQDNFYGTLGSEIERIWANGKHVVFDIDVVGGLQIKKKFPDQTLAIFVQPPNIEELERRLRTRNTEDESKIQMRISKAAKELGAASQFDIILENHDLETALQNAYNLVANFLNTKVQ